MGFVAEHPEFVSLMYEESKRRGPRMRGIVDRHVEPIFATIVALLDHGPTRRLFSEELTPIYFFYALAGASGAIFHQAEECKRLSGVDPFDPASVDQQARVIEWLFIGAGDDPTRSKSTEETP